jgi:hypothetical protein
VNRVTLNNRRPRSRRNAVLRYLGRLKLDDRGSVVTEFVLIATPLFLPALLFFNAMHKTASDEMNVSHLARQSVRAFATAPNLEIGHRRVKFLLDEFSRIESQSSQSGKIRYEFTYNIQCSSDRCLEPGSLVELVLYRQIPSTPELSASIDRKAMAVARTYVDKWRATE